MIEFVQTLVNRYRTRALDIILPGLFFLARYFDWSINFIRFICTQNRLHVNKTNSRASKMNKTSENCSQ